MTTSSQNPSDRFAAELLHSRRLGRLFANALAQPMAFKSRPLHRFETGVSLFKAGDRVTQLAYVMSGRLDAVVHVPGAQGGQIVPISFRAGEMAFLSYLFNQLPSGSDLVVGEPSTIQWLPLKDIEACMLNDQGLSVFSDSDCGRCKPVSAAGLRKGCSPGFVLAWHAWRLIGPAAQTVVPSSSLRMSK